MKKALTLLFISCIFLECVYSQNLTPPSNIIVSLQVSPSNGQVDPILLDSTALANLTYILKVAVTLNNVESVANLHVKVLKDSNSVFDENIPIGASDFQTNSYSYHKDGNVIYLDFGDYQGNGLLVEAYSEDENGVISSTISSQ